MKVLYIGAGGTGINWGLPFLTEYSDRTEKDTPNINFLFVDGSDANLRGKETFNADIWLVPDTDGGGKRRDLVAPLYLPFIKSRLKDIPDADVYILGYSWSGGSGSVFGPEIGRYLLSKGKSVINLSTVTSSSHQDTINATNVSNGLAFYAAEVKRPFVSFLQNGDTTPETEVNERVAVAMRAILYATSDSLSALDTADLRSFLDYSHTGIETGIAELTIASNVEEMRDGESTYITTLSVVPDTTHEKPKVNELLDVRAEGGSQCLYFGTRINTMSRLVSHLDARLKMFEEVRESHKVTNPFDSSKGMAY